MADLRTPAERAYDAQRDGSAYTKPINQDAAQAWERIQQITDDPTDDGASIGCLCIHRVSIQQITDNPTDDGRDAEAAEDTDEIIEILRQLDDGGE